MKTFLLLSVCLITRIFLFGQENTEKISFDDYCNRFALSYLKVPADKISSIEFSGELKIKEAGKTPELKDYKVKLKENTSQYYKLKNSDKVLVVKPLSLLRSNYSTYTGSKP
jgi:hypothetical protein